MAFINKQDTNGTKGTLLKGELGYDDYTAGGDAGRVYVGDGSTNIALAKKTEVDAKQVTLVSGTNIKTVNGTSLLGSGDIAVQPTLVSGTNIKTVGGISILGSGNIASGGLPTNSQTFTSSGTFTVPTGVTKVLVWACGGGSSGATGYSTTNVNGASGGSTYFGSINFFGAIAAHYTKNSAPGRNGSTCASKYGNAVNDGADGTFGGGGLTSPNTTNGTAASNIGAGGGGAVGRNGGASSCMDLELVSVTPGQVVTVTIGAGGPAVTGAGYTSGAGYRGEVRVYW